jgi:hypothetical protein
MTRIEPGAGGAFRIDGKSYQRGTLQPVRNGDLVGLVFNGRKQTPLGGELKRFDQYGNGAGVPFASADAFLAYLNTIIFL